MTEWSMLYPLQRGDSQECFLNVRADHINSFRSKRAVVIFLLNMIQRGGAAFRRRETEGCGLVCRILIVSSPNWLY